MYADEKASDDDTGSKERSSQEDGSSVDIDDDPVYSYAEQRSIIHRVDRRLVTTCGLLYCFSIVDRGNLGSASIAGFVSSVTPQMLSYDRSVF